MAKIYAFDRGWPRGPRGMVLLRKGQVWRQKGYPDAYWVIISLTYDNYDRIRVRFEPVWNRDLELNLSESYFRKHFEPMVDVLANKNWVAQTFLSHKERKWFWERCGLSVVDRSREEQKTTG